MGCLSVFLCDAQARARMYMPYAEELGLAINGSTGWGVLTHYAKATCPPCLICRPFFSSFFSPLLSRTVVSLNGFACGRMLLLADLCLVVATLNSTTRPHSLCAQKVGETSNEELRVVPCFRVSR